MNGSILSLTAILGIHVTWMSVFQVYYVLLWPNGSSSVTAIQQEKREVNIRKSLTEFEKGNLKHVQTEEKNPLPDATGMTPPTQDPPPEHQDP